MTGERRNPEQGETLIETLVTLMLMTIVVVGLLGALGAAVKISDQGWRLSQGSVQATNFSEAVLAMPYTPCTAGNTGTNGPAATYRSALTVPSGYTLTVSATYLTTTSPPASSSTPASATFGTCPSSDLGAQQLTFTLTRTTGGKYKAPTVTVIKRDDTCSAKAKVRVGYLPGQRC